MNNTINTAKLSASERVQRSLKKRYRSERMFRSFGIISIAIGLLALLVLFTEIISKGIGAFQQTYITLEVTLDREVLGLESVDEDSLALANFDGVVKKALRDFFPDVTKRGEKRELYAMLSYDNSYRLKDMLAAKPELLGQTIRMEMLADDDVDTYIKSLGDDEAFDARMSERQLEWIGQLQKEGRVEKRFNTILFTQGDSAEPEQAGILGAALGSFFTLLVTLALSFPIGVAAAVYLEEYAQKSRLTDFIEVNINNLAAVPSVIFGLLGLAIFLNFFSI